MARFTIKNVRLSFPNLFEKASYDGTPTKYEASFLIPKDDKANLAVINKAIMESLIEKFKTKDKIPKGITKGVKNCLRDGDDVDYDGYAGCMSLKAANKSRPTTLDRKKNNIGPDSGMLYAGCYVDAVCEIWTQDNQYGKRINCNLFAIRHRGEGEPFGAGSIPDGVADDFEDLEDDDSETEESGEYDLEDF